MPMPLLAATEGSCSTTVHPGTLHLRSVTRLRCCRWAPRDPPGVAASQLGESMGAEYCMVAVLHAMQCMACGLPVACPCTRGGGASTCTIGSSSSMSAVAAFARAPGREQRACKAFQKVVVPIFP